MSLLTLENLGYKYDSEKVNVLNNLNLEFKKGKIYSIIGKSGAGKTTLLSLLSGLASPTQGKIIYDGKDISKTDKYKYRSKNVGVVFQSFNLLPNLSGLENVILSMDIAGTKINKKEKEALAISILEKVELDEDEIRRRVLKLSGGQQQRIAIARALSYDPQIILADEPTGNLDGETQKEIMKIFRKLADEGKCVIIVTHSPTVAKESDVCFELKKQSKAQ